MRRKKRYEYIKSNRRFTKEEVKMNKEKEYHEFELRDIFTKEQIKAMKKAEEESNVLFRKEVKKFGEVCQNIIKKNKEGE